MTKTCTKCNTVKELTEFYKRTKSRDGLSFICKKCHTDYNKANKDKKTEYDKRYYKANSGTKKEYFKKYQKANKDKVNTINAKRRARKLNATPHWLTSEDYNYIEFLYRKARELTEQTGVSHHVDHIHPLQGKNICGLHCPLNLQILTAEENIKKSNKHE